ncbi:MAG: VWA domain-containing protein [Pseudomonadota bacterium]
MFEDFHFIRPLWFYALIPVLALFIWLFYKKQKAANWSKICDAELLNYFLVQNGKSVSRYPIILLLISWLFSVFALAGPSWEKVKSPIYSNQDALVIILDLSLSMNASDIKPSRLERAKHKLTDLLNQRQEGQTALLVYAGDAHIVSPLTPDNKTILSFVPVLDASLMPIAGSNLNAALQVAQRLFKNSGINQGRILLLSDGIQPDQQAELTKTIKNLQQSGYFLSIIGIGTVDGAPIPDKQKNGFIKDQQGNIVLSKLDELQLKKLSSIGNGSYHRLTLANDDIKSLLKNSSDKFKQQLNESNSQVSQQQWHDQGALFVLFILPLALLLFRKGWILGLLVIIMPIPYQPAYSMSWDDLWLRSDQQARQSFIAGKHQQAADKFSDPQWKGSSFYKAGKYQQALEQFSQSDSIEATYNKANSLAQLKQLDKAIEAYNEVLEKNPEHQDSKNNKKIIEDILKQQKQQQQQKGDKGDKQDNKKDSKEQKDENSDNSPENSPDKSKKQDSDKKNKDSEQQNQSQQDKQKQAEQEALNKQKEKQEKEKQAATEEKSEEDKQDKEQQDKEKQAKQSQFSKLSEEQQQSMEQYLNQIKDDPAYLLRRKFYLNSTRSKQQQNQTQQQW